MTGSLLGGLNHIPAGDFGADHRLGVTSDAQKPARAPGPQPRQAENINAGYAGYAAPIGRITGSIENRQPDIGPISRETGRPHDRAHSGRDKVKLGRLVVGLPDRLV